VAGYVGRRILAAVPLLLLILTIVFLLVEMAPGDPFSQEPGAGAGPQAAGRLRQAFGADRPLPERFGSWLGAFLSGDLGTSYSQRRPVASLLRESLAKTAVLAGIALALQFLWGTAAGILAAALRSRLWDRVVVLVASLLYSFPSYWIGLVMVSLFSVRLGWLPVSQMHSVEAASMGAWSRLLDAAGHLILPCLSLTLPAAAGIALYVREEMRSILGRDLVRNALARGATRREILLKHSLTGALLPVVTLLGLALPGLVGGSAVLEVLFAWPGMGRLAYQAVLSRDAPLILGCAWVGSIAVVAGSLLADVLSVWADPRLRDRLK